MKRTNETLILSESLDELQRALKHLHYSANAVAGLPGDLQGVSEEELDRVEAFTSRFARIADLVTNRVLRALDKFELHDSGTLLDVANRAEKRGLIDSVDWLREIKDVRNQIAHDYAGERLPELFAFVREELPRLLETCERIDTYSRKRLSS